MNYIQAFDLICDEIDLFYQYHYKKAYFDFKQKYQTGIANISVKAFLGKLDEYKFYNYVPSELNQEDLLCEKKMHVAIQRMCTAIRILNLFITFEQLTERELNSLYMDLNVVDLQRLYHEMPWSFGVLKEYLNNFVVAFHPRLTSTEDMMAVDALKRNMDIQIAKREKPLPNVTIQVDVVSVTPNVPLIRTRPTLYNKNYLDDDIVEAKERSCFPCSFFFSKKKDRQPLADSKNQKKYN